MLLPPQTPDVGGEGLGVKPGAPGSGGAAAAAASAVKAAPGGGVHHAAPVDGVHRAAPAGAAHNSGAPPPRPSNGSGAADIGARSASVDAAASVAPAAPGAAGAAGGKAPPAGAAGGAAALLHTAPARLEGAPPPAGALARALALPSQPASPSVSASQVRFREPLGPAAPAQAQDDQLVVGSPPESISPLGQHHQLHRQRPLPALPPPALPPAVGSPRRGDGPAPPAGGAPAANGAAPPPAAPPAAPALRSSLRPALRASRTLGAVGGGDAPGGAAPRAGVARGNKLRERRGGVSASFVELQDQLTSNAPVLPLVATRAAGLKHIGFGPFKRENQDEFFIQARRGSGAAAWAAAAARWAALAGGPAPALAAAKRTRARACARAARSATTAGCRARTSSACLTATGRTARTRPRTRARCCPCCWTRSSRSSSRWELLRARTRRSAPCAAGAWCCLGGFPGGCPRRHPPARRPAPAAQPHGLGPHCRGVDQGRGGGAHHRGVQRDGAQPHAGAAQRGGGGVRPGGGWGVGGGGRAAGCPPALCSALGAQAPALQSSTPPPPPRRRRA